MSGAWPWDRGERALQQAQAAGITLRKANNKSGYKNVSITPGSRPRPYLAQLRDNGKLVTLGSFATAEEAALCVARSPAGQAAAERVAAAARPRPTPPTREQALRQAQAEGVTLRRADNKTGYANVYVNYARTKPYHAQVSRMGSHITLGSFATPEEAALCVARSQEAAERAAAERAAAPLPMAQLMGEQARPQRASYANLTVQPSEEALQQARDATIGAVALEIIYEAAEAAAIELGAEVAAEVMAGIALGL